MILCYPIAFPIGKVNLVCFVRNVIVVSEHCLLLLYICLLYTVSSIFRVSLLTLYLLFSVKILDWVLGHNDALFRRAQLKALVSIHSQEVLETFKMLTTLFTSSQLVEFFGLLIWQPWLVFRLVRAVNLRMMRRQSLVEHLI